MKKGILLLVAILGLFVFVACGDSYESGSAAAPVVTEALTEAETEAPTEAPTEAETESTTEAETEPEYEDDEDDETAYHELVGEWSFLGTPWFRFYADGSALNLSDGEAFTWEEDGTVNAILYETWSVDGDTLTITWESGATFEYSRIAGSATAISSSDTGDYHELVGEWSYFNTPWFRFNADGTAENLSDGERFRWNEDGTFSDALVYDTWSIRGNTLTVTWTTGVSFTYSRD